MPKHPAETTQGARDSAPAANTDTNESRAAQDREKKAGTRQTAENAKRLRQTTPKPESDEP